MKEDWKEYLSFSKKERNGVMVLLVLVIVLNVLPYCIPPPEVVVDEAVTREWQSRLALWKNSKQPAPEPKRVRKAESLPAENHDAAGSRSGTASSAGPPPAAGILLFPFDPNHLSEKDWKLLGIPDRVIRTIFNYLQKGGRFRKPEDIARIYGMRSPDVKRLLPWVRISGRPGVGQGNKAAARPLKKKVFNDSIQYHSVTLPGIRRKRYTYIDINTADTSTWMGFPGIGSRLAFRIVQYREKLGGFHSPDQVAETRALPDSTFQKIKPWLQCRSGIFRKIRINTAGVDELRQHPYLRWHIANAIVQYRQQHGAFQSVADLQKIILITSVLITKIAPYIEY